jgi:predicted RNase H-like nuclease (RuvC/YqgF family)
MKLEVLSKALGRPVNLHHERIEDLVIELAEKLESQNKVNEYHRSMIVSYEKRIRNQSKEYKQLKRHKDWLENKLNELGEKMGYGK